MLAEPPPVCQILPAGRAVTVATARRLPGPGDAPPPARPDRVPVLWLELGARVRSVMALTTAVVLVVCLTSYVLAVDRDGTAAVTWACLLSGMAAALVGLLMGEAASSSLARTTPGRSPVVGSRAWAWLTGWFTVIGRTSVAAAVDHVVAAVVTVLLAGRVPDLVRADGRAALAVFILIAVPHVLLDVVNMYAHERFDGLCAGWYAAGGAVVVVGLTEAVVRGTDPPSLLRALGDVEPAGGGVEFWLVLGLGMLIVVHTIVGYDASSRTCAHRP